MEPPNKKHKAAEVSETNNDMAEGHANGATEVPAAKEGDIEPKGEAIKIPLSDLETIRQLEDIRSGCTICLLR